MMVKFKFMESIKAKLNSAKFNTAVRAVFIFAVMVSFSHTEALYRSVGFNGKFDWLNSFFGVDWLSHSLFATLASEVGFIVGFWSLHDAYMRKGTFPYFSKYWQEWTLFIGGLLIVAWSNIGATVGYNFLIGQPWKGIALGLSIPVFVFGSQLVHFKRKDEEAQIFAHENAHTQEIALEDVHKNLNAQAQNNAHAHAHENVSAQDSGAHTNTHAHDLNTNLDVHNESAHENTHAHAHTAQDPHAQGAQTEESEGTHTQSAHAQVGAQKEIAQSKHAQNLNAQTEENAHASAHAQSKDVQAGAQESAQGSSAQSEQLAQKENAQSDHAQNSDSQVAQNAHAQTTNAQTTSAQDAQSAQSINAQNNDTQSAHAQDAHAQNDNCAHEDINAQDKYAKLLASAQKEEIRLAMIRAIEYEQEHKEFPSINDLATLAGVTPWYARVALNTLQGKPTRRTRKPAKKTATG